VRFPAHLHGGEDHIGAQQFGSTPSIVTRHHGSRIVEQQHARRRIDRDDNFRVDS